MYKFEVTFNQSKGNHSIIEYSITDKVNDKPKAYERFCLLKQRAIICSILLSRFFVVKMLGKTRQSRCKTEEKCGPSETIKKRKNKENRPDQTSLPFNLSSIFSEL